MKKIFFTLLLSVLIATVNAQQVEIVKTIKFGDDFPFFEDNDPYEGKAVGITNLIISQSQDYILENPTNASWYMCGSNSNPAVLIQSDKSFGHQGFPICTNTKDGFIVGYMEAGVNHDEIYLYIRNDKKEWIIKDRLSLLDSNAVTNVTAVYQTDNIVFMQTKKCNLVSIELIADGSYRIRDIEETKRMLKGGKGEELGWKEYLWRENIVIRNCFGDFCVQRLPDGITYWKIWKDEIPLEMMDKKYINNNAMRKIDYDIFGIDKKGLQYFKKIEKTSGTNSSQQPEKNIKFSIAVLDTWTNKVYFYEDYKENEWNPPRDEEGALIGSYEWTVAPDGNIYFADADVKKGEYQIKRIKNEWYTEIGIDNRRIGQVTANHIPLQINPDTAAGNNGYNFENDYVWEQERKGGWSKIRKVDGREGWIETKYINFE